MGLTPPCSTGTEEVPGVMSRRRAPRSKNGPQLNGCNTCPRNDTVGLKTLSRIKPLLGSAA